MPDLIPAKDGILDRHPETFGFYALASGFRRNDEWGTIGGCKYT